ncbi:MAG: hypothetical protein ACT4P1_00585 [Sporichthyaceae bacterium]
MKHMTRTGVATAAAFALFAGPAAPASGSETVAAPYGDTPTAGVGTTTPGNGASIQLTLRNYFPGERININILSKPERLRSVKADGAGSFTGRIALPKKFCGKHTLRSTGAQTKLVTSVKVTIKTPKNKKCKNGLVKKKKKK